jgi:uncharacterized protein YciI
MLRGMRIFPIIVLVVLVMLCGGCATRDRADFVFVNLKSGPTSGSGTKDERQKMFAGHMANINRLAGEKKLLIAGPFAAPTDKTWRGLFVLDTGSLDEARAWVDTDPGVIAGEFAPELRVMSASESLRMTLALEEAAKAKRVPDPAKPMQGMRKYVILSCKDLACGLREAERAGIRVVWCGQGKRGTGVAVLDAEDPAAVREKFGNCGCTADGWFSTESLLGLPQEAARPVR